MDALSEPPPVESLTAEIEAAQADLQSSINRAGLRDDPFRHVLQALSGILGVFPRVIEEARQPVDPGSVGRVEAAAAAGAERRVAALARAHNLRTVMSAATGLVGALIIGAGCGYWVGRNSQLVTKSEVEAAAFRDGPNAADTWLNLMRANDGRVVRAACAASTAVTDGNRRACALGLWIEAPNNPAPRTIPATK